MPCCPREDPVTHSAQLARGVLLPTAALTHIAHAVRPACHWLWRVHLINEGRGVYMAVFDLEAMVAVAESTRTYAA